tara:strand:- start:65413 stop:66105 length:693 start_codon:yes stop_codon:yes gene_type:complete
VTTDLRTQVGADLRLHPRVAYQGLCANPAAAEAIAAALRPITPFRSDYVGAICILDWDHRLPSKALALRIYAYYDDDSYEAGQEAYDDRLESIGDSDRFPEFDVPDFDLLAADEAYEIEISLDGSIGRSRLTSAWRRNIAIEDGDSAISVVRESEEFIALQKESKDRPAHLGDLEAVSWTPPCESEHNEWTLDVWFLQAFDGRVGSGRSFLVDPATNTVVAVRDFSVRTG